MNKLQCELASAVFAIAALRGGSAIHAHDVHKEQAARKADAQEAARVGENPLLGTWKPQSLLSEVIATGERSKPWDEHPKATSATFEMGV